MYQLDFYSPNCRIVGPPCIFKCSKKQVCKNDSTTRKNANFTILLTHFQTPLPNSIRPIYSTLMEGVVICFTGFKSKEELHHLCSLAHLMGASIRKDMAATVTHVVAHVVQGSKYKVCTTDLTVL